MFGMIEHVKALAAAQAKLIKMLLAAERSRSNVFTEKSLQEETKMDNALKKLGINIGEQ